MPPSLLVGVQKGLQTNFLHTKLACTFSAIAFLARNTASSCFTKDRTHRSECSLDLELSAYLSLGSRFVLGIRVSLAHQHVPCAQTLRLLRDNFLVELFAHTAYVQSEFGHYFRRGLARPRMCFRAVLLHACHHSQRVPRSCCST